MNVINCMCRRRAYDDRRLVDVRWPRIGEIMEDAEPGLPGVAGRRKASRVYAVICYEEFCACDTSIPDDDVSYAEIHEGVDCGSRHAACSDY